MSLESLFVGRVVEAGIDLDHVHADVLLGQQSTVHSVDVGAFVVLREAEGVPELCRHLH